MLGHARYARDRSKSLLTAFNRVVSGASYQTIKSARIIMTSYAVKWLADGETPIPSSFTRDDYTIAGLDKSPLSGTMGSHYVALVLFQDATLNRPPPPLNLQRQVQECAIPIQSCGKVVMSRGRPTSTCQADGSINPATRHVSSSGKQASDFARQADCPKCSC